MKSETKSSLSTLGLLGILAVVSLFRLKTISPVQNTKNSVYPQGHPEHKNQDADQLQLLTSQVPPANERSDNSRKCCHHKTPWWKITLEVATLLAVGLYTCFTYKLMTATQGMLEGSDRPWIKDTVVSAFEMGWQNGSYLGWDVTVRTENIGRSVATGIFPETKLIAIKGADFIDYPRREAKKVCDAADAHFDKIKDDPTAWANSAFPETWLEFPQGVHLLESEVEKNSFDGGANLGKSIHPMLVGCILYHYPSSEHAHHTGFVYVLSHSDDPALAEATRAFFGIGRNIPKEKVVLLKVGQFAD